MPLLNQSRVSLHELPLQFTVVFIDLQALLPDQLLMFLYDAAADHPSVYSVGYFLFGHVLQKVTAVQTQLETTHYLLQSQLHLLFLPPHALKSLQVPIFVANETTKQFLLVNAVRFADLFQKFRTINIANLKGIGPHHLADLVQK